MFESVRSVVCGRAKHGQTKPNAGHGLGCFSANAEEEWKQAGLGNAGERVVYYGITWRSVVTCMGKCGECVAM